VADVSIYGVRETLADLRELDKKLFFAAVREIKQAARPMQSAMQANLPSEPPLSGMARGRTAYTRKSRKVDVKYGGRKDRTKEEWPLLKLQLADAGGAIYDMAGKNTTTQFTAALSARANAGPSRAMWRVEDTVKRETEEAVKAAVARASKQVNQELVTRPAGA
jgi:hypothetical protein